MRHSIITVTRNSNVVLPRAIASLAQQTCNDFEWVVVDGASRDGTVAIRRRFEGARAQIVRRIDPIGGRDMRKGTHTQDGRLMHTEVLRFRRRELSRRERVLAQSCTLLLNRIRLPLGLPQDGCSVAPDSGTQA